MIINNKINSSQVSLIIRWIDKQVRTMVLTEIFISYLFSPVRNAISLSTNGFCGRTRIRISISIISH